MTGRPSAQERTLGADPSEEVDGERLRLAPVATLSPTVSLADASRRVWLLAAWFVIGRGECDTDGESLERADKDHIVSCERDPARLLDNLLMRGIYGYPCSMDRARRSRLCACSPVPGQRQPSLEFGRVPQSLHTEGRDMLVMSLSSLKLSILGCRRVTVS